MSWPLKMIDFQAPEYEGRGWPAGSCWFITPENWGGYEAVMEQISPEYVRDWQDKRPPLMVAIPGRGTDGWTFPFCVDMRASDSPNGWSLTGEPPNISVTPSIDAVGAYHGHITNGVLTDDIGN